MKKYYLTKNRRAANRKIWTLLIAFVIGSTVIGISSQSVARDIGGINTLNGLETPLEGEIMAFKAILNPTKQQVEAEIRKQAKLFSLDPDTMVALAVCESGLDYKAKNVNSTARGTFQYLIGTWEATESAKKGYERNDYRANIREAMIDISNGELWRWKDCAKQLGI